MTIDDTLYGELAAHFTTRQIMEVCFTVGLSNLVNRFHATFLTDVDESTLAEIASTTCPLPLPRSARSHSLNGADIVVPSA